MKDLIKKFLYEQVDRKEIETKLRRWVADTEGEGEEIKKLQAKLILNQPISDEEYDFAKEFFEKEVKKRKISSNTMSHKIKPSFKDKAKDQKNELMSLGTKAYLDLIKTDLSVFFNEAFNPKLKMKIGTPSDSWFIQNYNDLVLFQQKTIQWENNNVDWRDGSSMTIKSKIDELKKKLKDKNFIGLIEGGDWSILNHLDTHYTFWADEITKRQINHDLPMGSDITVIRNYFRPRRLDSVLPKGWLEKLNQLKKDKGLNINSMSFAHVDLLEKFHEEKEKEFSDMKEKITRTTRFGEDAETDFLTLIENSPEKVNGIKKYASWGNVVDMVFGVDMMANFVDGFKIVQVKNSKSKSQWAFIRKLGIPYLSVFPKGGRNKYNFLYFSENNKDIEESFNQNYLSVEKKVEKPITYQEKEMNALRKVIGNTISDYLGKK